MTNNDVAAARPKGNILVGTLGLGITSLPDSRHPPLSSAAT